ncbi:hemagglutinin repeat-containing protein [Photobacterium sp. 2_MG-2023]|uniref:two-partner secretion domain-containing protein n=1 Tax=Photobacterium sp. 2_MG-2023 TaxID=3062663 RepID=UPI0026E1159C|nr:hemagglutinin repeat-containing protein [Photobacterium sp. 2_MG-2023]MDO6582175.1 hemagglutinin repeat-containing protein [Photobacterium sp. 2_MG-2023]
MRHRNHKFTQVLTYVLCWMLATQPVWATIQVDSSSKNNTTISAAANGVPVVNIAAPNASGLSHNQFQQYNVGKEGLILNNSTEKLAQSQLGGYLQGNAQLNGRAASVILNEVTGANRSQLNGYTEVFGQQANVIVANPYGITCNGCGFLNTPRATLTTGVPQFQSGLLSGFDIRQGDVTVTGQGLDGTQQDYFDILARTAKINADIHANNLSVVTGPNQIDYLTNDVTATHDVKDKPLLAIDSSALGGMYAGRISLVATEQGVGVNTGRLFSIVGDIQISADGQISLGDVSSKQSLTVQSNQSVTTTGTQQAGQNIEYVAAGDLLLNSENSAAQFQATAGDQIHQNSLVAATESASFSGSEVNFQDSETVSQTIRVQADAIRLQNSTLIAGVAADGSESHNGRVDLTGADVSLSDSRIQVSGELSSVAQTLSLDAPSQIAAEHASLAGISQLTNEGQIAVKQTLTIANPQSLTLQGAGTTHAGTLELQAGTIQNHSQLIANQLNAEAETIDNSGKLVSAGGQTLRVTGLLTNQGAIQSAGEQSITAGTFSQQSTGVMTSQAEQQIVAEQIDNAGTLAAAGAQRLSVSGQLTNTGQIQAVGDQFVDADWFAQKGRVSSDANSQLTAGSLINDGDLTSLGDMSISVDTLTLNQAATANGDLDVNTTGDMVLNHNLSAGGDARLSAGGKLSNKGKLVAQGQTTVSVGGTFTNLATGLISGNTTVLNAGMLTNQGTIQALTNLMATLTQFTNQGATLGMQDTTLNVAGNLTNTGLLYAGDQGYFYVKGHLINTEADILTSGKMVIAGDASGAMASSVQNISGVIQSGADLDMKAQNIVNKRKVLEIEKSSGEGVQLDPHYNQNEFTVGRNSPYAPSYSEEEKCTEGNGGEKDERCETSYSVSYDFHNFVVVQEKLVVTQQSAASQIVVGGHASLNANTLKNDASLLHVNKNLNISANTLENKGYKTGVYTTTATYRLKDHDGIKSFTYGLTSKNTTESGVGVVSSTISSGGITNFNVKNEINNSDIKSNIGLTNAGRPDKQAQQAGVQTAAGNQLDLALNTSTNNIPFPDFRLPTSPNGLFVYNNGPDSQYLIETNPALTNLDQFLGSDYFFDSIGFDPQKDLKVLGDAFYDTRTITSAIFEQTGQRYLNDDVGTDLDQMQQLLDSAGQQKDSLSLQAGVALTPEQVAGLTQDIVWWEPVDVNGQQVLAPKLYLSKVTQDNLSGGALISGSEVYAEAGNIINSGQMDSKGKLHLVSDDNISNLGGSMTAGGDIEMDAVNDIQNISGQIAGENIALSTEKGDIINRTEVERVSITQNGAVTTADDASGVVYTDTRVGETASINGRGTITMSAGGSIKNTAANVTAGGDLSVKAEKDIIVTAETQRDYLKTRDQEHLDVAVLGSGLSSGGNLSFDAGENISVTASDMYAEGELAMVAGWDVALNTLVNEAFSREETHNSQSVSHIRQHQGTQLAANDGVFIQSGNDITATGSQMSTQGDVVVLAKGDITFQAVNDSEYRYDQTTKKKSFGRRETSIQESLTETVVGADVSAGGKIIVKAQKFGSVQTAGGDSDITIVGSNFTAGEGIEASADGDVTVTAQQYQSYSRNETIKQGFGGLSGSHKSEVDSATLLDTSGMMSSDNIDITSGKSITLVASDVEAEGDITATAVDEVIIAAGQESRQHETFEQEYGAFRGGDLFSMDSERQGEIHNTAKGSALSSGGTVNINGGSVTVIGSDVSAEADANFTADTGSVTVLAAEENHSTWSSTESLSVNVEDALKSVVNPYESVNFDGGQAKLTLAKAEYSKADNKTDATTHRGASIIGKGTVLMDAAEDIVIQGSDVLADADDDGNGNIELTAAENVLIREVLDTESTTSSSMQGEAELSLVVQHQAVETGKAAIALKESADKLKQAEKDYRQYQKQVDSLENTLSELEQALANHEPGVSAADIAELKGIISDVKSDEAFYLASITLATVDVASKTTLLMKQGAAAAQSTSTLGIDAGLHLDMSVTQTDSKSTSSTARGSSLAGQNIIVNSGTQTDQQILVQGSSLTAKEGVTLDGGTVSVLAAEQTQQSQSQTESGTISASMTVHGSSTGGSLNASLNQSEQRSQSTTYVNSGVSGSHITINSRGDTHIQGANVDAAESLNLDIGGDLSVASVQDRHSSSNQGAGISGGVSLSGQGETTGSNGGLNASSGRVISSETQLTTLTSGGKAEIKVAGNTDITGALIATVDENGNDLNNLTLNTGSLSYSDLNNTDYRQDQSAGLTTSVGVQQGGIDSTYNSSNLQYKNTSSYSKDKTLATLGQGEITLSDDSDLTALNRDISNTSRDLFEVDRQQGNVDVTLDHRLLTEEGRHNIAEDVKRNELGLSSLADVVTKDSVSVGDTFEHVDNVQKNLDVQKLVASQAEGKFAVILNNLDTATASEKQAAINAYAAAYAEVYGVNIDSALVVAVTKMTHGAHYMNGNGASKIVINDETMKNAKDYMTTLGHEVTHGQVAQGGLDSRENKTLNEEYASLMGGYSADNYAFVLENSGLGTVREGDINRHHGNQSALISRNSSNYLADEAVLPAGSIEYYLNQEEVQKKLSLLASCNQQGAGSAACQQLNQTNQLDHMRDAELQAACKDMSSPGCRAQIAKAQAALDSFDEGASPWDDTRLGQEQESIRTVLNDPSGRARQAQQEKLDLAFNVLADFSPGVGDAKGFAEAETKLDYLLATVGLVPVAGDLVKMAADAFKVGKVGEAQKLLSKAQEHFQHVDADFDDLSSSNPLALTDKGSSHSPELPHSGQKDGNSVALHEKPSTPEAESTLAKQETEGQGSDVGDDDGRMQGEGVVSNTKVLTRAERLEIQQTLQTRVGEIREELPKKLRGSGNMGVAQLDIPGLPSELKAHSRINNPVDKGADGFVHLADESNWVFKPKTVDPDNVRVDTPDAYTRQWDTEFKILNDVALRLGNNKNATGSINLFTERLTCTSCTDVIFDFKARYPNIQLNVFAGE